MTASVGTLDTLSDLGRAALDYAGHGWRVFPVWGIDGTGNCMCPGRPDCTPGKHPLIKGGHKGATVDAATIRRWWTRHPQANIGLNCEASGVVVVDIDPRNGGDATARRLIAEHGNFQSPVCSDTGGGGQHHFFRPPAGSWATSPASERPGIDLKHSGYVVLPPSAHKDRTGYAWQPNRDPGGYLLLDAPPCLPAAFLAGARGRPNPMMMTIGATCSRIAART